MNNKPINETKQNLEGYPKENICKSDNYFHKIKSTNAGEYDHYIMFYTKENDKIIKENCYLESGYLGKHEAFYDTNKLIKIYFYNLDEIRNCTTGPAIICYH